MAKPVKVRTSSGEWADLAIQVPSANEPTFTGTTSSSQFSATNSVGDEGGEIKFAKAATNTTLNTGVTLDVYQDKVRLFETAGTNRGGYFDMTTLGAGVSTNLAPGLTHINTTSFSAVSSVSLNNIFTSTYDSYYITMVETNSSHQEIRARFRLSGTDNSTSSYNFQVMGRESSGAVSSSSINQTSIFCGVGGTTRGSFAWTIFNPNNSAVKTITCANSYISVGINEGTFFSGTSFNGTTQFDGITFYPNSGTITGTVRVYGYRNS